MKKDLSTRLRRVGLISVGIGLIVVYGFTLVFAATHSVRGNLMLAVVSLCMAVWVVGYDLEKKPKVDEHFVWPGIYSRVTIISLVCIGFSIWHVVGSTMRPPELQLWFVYLPVFGTTFLWVNKQAIEATRVARRQKV